MGRNKKNGERYPGGKLKPTGEPIQPALWQRVRVDVAKLAGDSRLASQVGRLSFHRELSDTQATAAFRVGAIYGTYERNHGKRRRIASPSYQRGSAGGDSKAGEGLFIDKAFNALQDEIAIIALTVEWPAESGSRWTRNRPTDDRLRSLLEIVCVDDCAIDPRYLDLFRYALDELALFFGISKSRKSGQPRKAPRAVRHVSPAPPVLIAVPKGASTEKIAYLLMLKAMRPDLDEDGRARAWELFEAMKDREKFNRSKPSRSVKEKSP